MTLGPGDRGQAHGQIRLVAERYLDAKAAVIAAGYGDEIDWQEERSLDRITESVFMREAAWVILSGGMSERVIRGRFVQVSRAFLGFRSATAVVSDAMWCRAAALRAFAHPGKIDAILAIVAHVAEFGIDHVRDACRDDAVEYLMQFAYLGPATSRHLAKNLGAQVAKPDRHLKRIAMATGYPSVDALCQALAAFLFECPSVVDVVLWRYATLRPGYVADFDLSSQ